MCRVCGRASVQGKKIQTCLHRHDLSALFLGTSNPDELAEFQVWRNSIKACDAQLEAELGACTARCSTVQLSLKLAKHILMLIRSVQWLSVV